MDDGSFLFSTFLRCYPIHQKSGTTSPTSTTQWCAQIYSQKLLFPIGWYLIKKTLLQHVQLPPLQLEMVRLSSPWRTLALLARPSESTTCGDASGACAVHVGIGGGGLYCEMLGCTMDFEGMQHHDTNQQKEKSWFFPRSFSFLKCIQVHYDIVFRVLLV